ncbi:MAG: SprT-like domain-containing protein [Chitinophagaceae bacterium]|nr:SprT-like domain-containing protein [Chitinophagaceae bacterium]
MAKVESPLVGLKEYLPDGSFEEVAYYLQHHKVHLTITKKRQSILGDYRHAHAHNAHRISVNGNLNSYAFLITLLHELAHLFTFEMYKNRVQAHGKEWQNEFSKILAQFLLKKIFPADIEKALLKTLQGPAASSCGDEGLMRVLHKYDIKKEGVCLVEHIAEGQLFAIKGQRIFKRGEKIRKRYKCMEIKTGKLYLFSGVYEVLMVKNT